MKKPFLLTLCVALLLLPTASPGWSSFVHRTIAQLSVYSLPSAMQPFYFRHMKKLVGLSTAADIRRQTDPKEAGKQYIFMDQYGDDPFGAMPKAWDKAEAKFTADTLRKYGTLPWTIMDVKDDLTAAFKNRDTVAILRLSADLCYYVTEAYGPLHTTLNYDGQLTDQAGIQGLWEGKLPERHIAEYKLYNKDESAGYVKDPLADVWKVIQESYGFLGATFDLEEKVTKKFTPEKKFVFSHKYGKTRRTYSDEFADAYHKEVGGMVMFRMMKAPTFVASLWLTAWKDAGSPNLLELLPKKPEKEEKEKLKADVAAFKDNKLVEEQILLALQKEEVTRLPDQINSAVDMAPPVLEAGEPAVADTAAAPAVAADAKGKKAKGKKGKAAEAAKAAAAAPPPGAAPAAGAAATPAAAGAAPAAQPAAPVPAAPSANTEKVKTKTKTAEGTAKQKEKAKKPAKKADDGWGNAPSGW